MKRAHVSPHHFELTVIIEPSAPGLNNVFLLHRPSFARTTMCHRILSPVSSDHT